MPSTGSRTPRLRFHAVTVVPGARACAQAESVRGLRLLSAEAPRLPMAGCDRPGDCECRFKHHDDRRVGPRRHVTRGGGVREERRRLTGRRDEDFPSD